MDEYDREVNKEIAKGGGEVVVDQVFDNIASENLKALRNIFDRALKYGTLSNDIGQGALTTARTIFLDGLHDIEGYIDAGRDIRSTPSGRYYWITTKFVDWGKVNWIPYDPGYPATAMDIMGNFLHQRLVN